MNVHSPFDLDVELTQLGLRPSDLERLCGVERTTVWKWRCGRLPVPAYARTILRQQQSIRSLAAALAEAKVGR